MFIKIKQGKKVHGYGDRSYLNSSTEIIKVGTQFPGCKKTKVGCAHEEITCRRSKLHIATIPNVRHVFCEDPCDPNAKVIPMEKLDVDLFKGCKDC